MPFTLDQFAQGKALAWDAKDDDNKQPFNGLVQTLAAMTRGPDALPGLPVHDAYEALGFTTWGREDSDPMKILAFEAMANLAKRERHSDNLRMLLHSSEGTAETLLAAAEGDEQVVSLSTRIQEMRRDLAETAAAWIDRPATAIPEGETAKERQSRESRIGFDLKQDAFLAERLVEWFPDMRDRLADTMLGSAERTLSLKQPEYFDVALSIAGMAAPESAARGGAFAMLHDHIAGTRAGWANIRVRELQQSDDPAITAFAAGELALLRARDPSPTGQKVQRAHEAIAYIDRHGHAWDEDWDPGVIPLLIGLAKDPALADRRHAQLRGNIVTAAETYAKDPDHKIDLLGLRTIESQSRYDRSPLEDRLSGAHYLLRDMEKIRDDQEKEVDGRRVSVTGFSAMLHTPEYLAQRERKADQAADRLPEAERARYYADKEDRAREATANARQEALDRPLVMDRISTLDDMQHKVLNCVVPDLVDIGTNCPYEVGVRLASWFAPYTHRMAKGEQTQFIGFASDVLLAPGAKPAEAYEIGRKIAEKLEPGTRQQQMAIALLEPYWIAIGAQSQEFLKTSLHNNTIFRPNLAPYAKAQEGQIGMVHAAWRALARGPAGRLMEAMHLTPDMTSLAARSEALRDELKHKPAPAQPSSESSPTV